MKKGEKSTRTLNIEKIAEFFGIGTTAIYNQLREETKTSNLHVKKAFEYISNGLPYYDMNELLRLLCIDLSEWNYLCRFTCCWNIDSDGKIKQSLDCVCNGVKYFSLHSGIDGINDILQQIGMIYKLNEPKTFTNLKVWSYER